MAKLAINHAKRTVTIITCAFGLLMILSSLKLGGNEPNKAIKVPGNMNQSAPHPVVSINGNAALTSHGNISGGPGNSWADAYIFEDYEIDGGYSSSCMVIENTNLYFIIRNCTLEYSSSGANDAGIYLYNSDNVRIENCTFRNNRNGISSVFSSNIEIIDNNISSSSSTGLYGSVSANMNLTGNNITSSGYMGIRLSQCNYTNIESNNISLSSDYGMYVSYSHHGRVKDNTLDNAITAVLGGGIAFSSSSNHTFTNNELVYSGFTFYGELSYMANLSIDKSNTLDGNPIHCYIGENNLDASNFTNPGQVILINCNDSVINGMNWSNGYIGISLYYGQNISVVGCELSNNNQFGVFTRYTIDSKIVNSNIAGNTIWGISGDYASNISVIGNNLTGSPRGISIDTTDHFNISKNNISSNTYLGVYLDGSDNTTIFNNSITNNGRYGVQLDSNCDDNTIILNDISHVGSLYDAIILQNSNTGNNITSNTITGFRDSIFLSISDGNTIHNNTIISCSRDAISLSSSDGNTILNNDITPNPSHEGIFLTNSMGNTIENNSISGGLHAIYLLSSSNVNDIIGNNITGPSTWGIRLNAFVSCNIKDNTITNSQFGIYLSSGTTLNVSGNDVEASSQGILLGTCEGGTALDNELEGCGFHLTGSLAQMASHTIDTSNTANGNTIYYYKHEDGLTPANFTNPGQIILVNCSNSSISNMEISDTGAAILLAHSNTNNTISGNNLTGDFWGIYLYFSENTTIIGNNCSSGSNGIYVNYGGNNNITGNVLENISGDGISIISSTFCTIMGNNVSSANMGIRIQYEDNNEVMNNLISDCDFGIRIRESNSNVVTGNQVNGNLCRWGIYLLLGSSENYFAMNNVSEASDAGILVDSSHNNTFWRNNVTLNNDGVYITGTSANNTIHCNIFSSNMQEGFIDSTGTGNAFDDGVLGNYWGDYTTRYPGATQNGLVWDIPYELGPTSINDTYPLFYQPGSFPISANFSINTSAIISLDDSVLFTFTGSEGDPTATFLWDFGDGTATSTDRNPIHQYSTQGNFTVTVTVTDVDGDSDQLVRTGAIYVNLSPVASFSASQDQVTVGSTVQFTFTGSEGNTPATYNWNFGDGSGNSTEMNPEHQFTEVGTYIIRLTVTDNDGESRTSSITIVVAKANDSLIIGLTIGIISGVAGVLAAIWYFKIYKKKRSVKTEPKE